MIKKLCLVLIIVFPLLFACATDNPPTAGNMAFQGGVDIGTDLLQHINPDPVSLVWGGIGMAIKGIEFVLAITNKTNNEHTIPRDHIAEEIAKEKKEKLLTSNTDIFDSHSTSKPKLKNRVTYKKNNKNEIVYIDNTSLTRYIVIDDNDNLSNNSVEFITVK